MRVLLGVDPHVDAAVVPRQAATSRRD
jgi:hypothetical protein